MMRNRPISLSVLLAVPVMLFLAHHYFYHSPGLYPTGFTVDENVLYMSYARQYLDTDSFHLFYSNPFDGDPESPRIYFQPINFVLAALVKLGLAPGASLSLVGLIMAICCIYLGIRIIRLLVPTSGYPVTTSILFTWGGGLTAIAGIFISVIMPSYAYPSWLDNIFIADPANGWWGLNWGRNLFIPLEAYYHFLFLLNIYFILQKKWGASLVAAWFLSISHPFTGITFLLIGSTWVLVEKVFLKNKNIRWWYAGGMVLVTAFHGWYYLIWLNRFPEHRQLFSQYSAGWTYSLLVAIPAYCLVLFLALLTLRKRKSLVRFLRLPHQRLFLAWAIISFLLSKHEWFMKPMQPIHFTRGYTWAGLFLLALPGIVGIIDYLKQKKKKWLLVALILIFLSDNILWTTNILRKKETTEWEGHLTSETREVLDYLSSHTQPRDLIVGNATLVNYLAHAYTPANSWVSHPYNTPRKMDRREIMEVFLNNGVIPGEWKNRRIIIVENKSAGSLLYSGKTVLFENESYRVTIP